LTLFWEGGAAASAILGCAPGAILGGVLSDRYGRKITLIVCAVLFLMAAIGSALPAEFTVFLAARFIGGVAIGICSMVCPVYISESSTADLRGRLGTLFQLGIVLGIFLTLFVNALIQSLGDVAWNENYGWRWMLGLGALPALLLLLMLRNIPESPRWLMQQGREDLARNVLGRWLNPSQVELEIRSVSCALVTEVGRLGEIFLRSARRPLVIAAVLGALAQLSGINAVMYYSTRIFTEAGTGVEDAFTATVVVGFVNLLFTVIAISLVDRIGRRSLLIAGLTFQVLSLSAVASIFYFQMNFAGLLVAILVFIASFAVALGPIGWLLASEIFPSRVRAKAMSFVACTVWVSCFAVAQTFPLLNDSDNLGPAGTFSLYAAISFLGLFFVFFFVPETKGRTLEEIEASWK
jgi:SP family arabinose:H+ symporter-like MFS transporter